jgi:hypothetical protein
VAEETEAARTPEERPYSLRLFVAAGAVVYSYVTLLVVFVGLCALPSNLQHDLFSISTIRWLEATRDGLFAPLSAVLKPLGTLPGGPFFQMGLPLALNVWVFLRSLKIHRRRWLPALAWRALNGYLLALSFLCAGATAAFVALFLVMALVFGLVAGLEALSR